MDREGSEPSTYLSQRVGPWVAGFAKAGSIFWARFGARHTETFPCGVGLGAAWRTLLSPSGDFFLKFPPCSARSAAPSLLPWPKLRRRSCLERSAQLPAASARETSAASQLLMAPFALKPLSAKLFNPRVLRPYFP